MDTLIHFLLGVFVGNPSVLIVVCPLRPQSWQAVVVQSLWRGEGNANRETGIPSHSTAASCGRLLSHREGSKAYLEASVISSCRCCFKEIIYQSKTTSQSASWRNCTSEEDILLFTKCSFLLIQHYLINPLHFTESFYNMNHPHL